MSSASVLSPERRIELNPFDVDAWNLLLRESSARPIDQARTFYEKLVTQFPNAGRYWKAYIEHELRAKNMENVEKLFERCLFKVLHIDLWKSYVYYMKETKGHLPEFREKVAEAFDCAIDRVGMDIQASQIYLEYIQFLKSVEAIGQYAENQRVSAVRKVYQKAFTTPLVNLDAVWQEYCTFEKAVNVNLAEKLIADRVKEYQHVKKVLKQMEQIMQGINRQAISVPARGSVAEQKQIDLWRKYIAYEKTNPLRTEEVGLVAKRVIYAYDQALLSLGYHADIWYESACFHEKIAVELKERGDIKTAEIIEQETTKLYNRATTGLMRDTPLIHFAHADFEESKGNYAAAKVIYDKLIHFENSDPTLAYIMLMNFVRRTEGIRAARHVFQKARSDKRCQFHIYIAGAMMEFHCSKDAGVAQKIFDYGLKQYGNIPEYATAYVDFLTYINDDNNTRIVIERLLESPEISNELRIDMWDRYLDLETRSGNATSLHKVDQARRQALNAIYEDRQALFLVDKFKFSNLWPCSPDQLKLMGYGKINRLNSGNVATASTSSHRYSNQPGPKVNVNLEISGFPRPDTSQMLAFKAASRSAQSFHPVPGGTFPPPKSVAFMLSKLPPPDSFAGPFVDAAHLMDTLAQFSREPPRANYKGSIDVNGSIGNIKVADMRREFQQLVTTTTDPAVLYASEEYKKHNRKRKNDSDSEDEANGVISETGDVFKRRMNAKVKSREIGQA